MFKLPLIPRCMASFYDFLCYYSLQHFDPLMDEFPTSIHSTLSPPSSSSAVSTVLPEATVGNFNEFEILRWIPLTNFGMCNPNTTEYFPRRGLVQAKDD